MQVLNINPINPEMDRIKIAAAEIKSGGIVVFPTETVYGIGADAFNGDACAKIFDIKGRPRDNPLIVHISKLDQLKEVAEYTDEIIGIAKILWPGPVTFILKKNKKIPDEVSAGLETVAVRMPAHPIALRLIDESGTPIAAPSANISKKPSATKASHVIKELNEKVDIIIDGGDVAFGIESTIIDMTKKPRMLLRPGAFTMEELEKYLGEITIPKSVNMQIEDSQAPIAPGLKYKHYSPETRLVVIKDNKTLIEAANFVSKKNKIVVLCSDEVAERIKKEIPVIKLGSESSLYEIAKNLFDSFRKIDTMKVDIAFVQSFPERGIGLAIMNRIIKASGSEPINSIEELKELGVL
jgi:L-threonylcarbamoyladenylate synthase